MSNSPPPTGEPTDLQEMVAQVERRNGVLVRLATGVDRLSGEVRGLRKEIDDRPTRHQVAHRRRAAAAAMLIYGMLIIWGHDTHVQYCSPGATALQVVESVADRDAVGKGLTRGQIKRIVDDSQPTAVCDVTFPLHTHGADPHAQPGTHTIGGWHFTNWNLIGFAGYGLAGGILLWWRRGPRPRLDR